MKKTSKRFLSMLLALFMVFGMLPMNALAAESDGVIDTIAELQAAIDAAADGETITVDQILYVNEGETVALDLKGKTVNLVSIYNSGDLTVTNGTLVGTSSEESVIETSAGSLTLQDVNASGPRHVIRVKGGEVTINSGDYKVLGTAGMTTHVVNASAGTVTINDGTFVGPKKTAGDSGTTVLAQGTAAVTINGGNFSEASNGYGNETVTATTGTITVKGGTFDGDVTAYLAEGYVQNEDGSVTKLVAGTITTGYAQQASDRSRIYGDIVNLSASESVVIKLYSGETLLATTELAEMSYIGYPTLTYNIVIGGSTSSAWNTVWEEGHPVSNVVPDKVVLYVDGKEMGSAAVTMGTPDDLGTPAVWAELQGVETAVITIDLSEDPYTIETAGKYIVIGGNVTNNLTVKADATITLSGVNVTAGEGLSAISVESGNVTLIVDGENTLTGGTKGAGIYVAEGASVTIEDTNEADDKLTAIGNAGEDVKGTGAAGIGGTYANGNSGAITIDGATVVAEGYGDHAAGIGSGKGGVCGAITITNDAVVTAQGGFYSEGGLLQSDYGKSDPEGGAAIGGGSGRSDKVNGLIKIEDSTVTAYGGSKAAGIGAGYWGSCVVEIADSTVTAYGGGSSAGIGTSRISGHHVTADIAITDSNVTAVGGEYGAGIGGGYNGNSRTDLPNPSSTIVISGGEVNATGGNGGAAIGGGYKTNNSKIKITGDTVVTANAGKLSDDDGDGKTIAQTCANGIGSGANGSGTFAGSEITIADTATVTVNTYAGGKDPIEGVVVEGKENITVNYITYVAQIGDTKYQDLAEALNACKKGETVVLLTDVDLNNEEWAPVGTKSAPFQGNFDGNGYTISNLKITGNNSDVGLFGYTTNGEIKNLTINNAQVSGYLDVGVVAGTPYTSKYTNITVTGDVVVNGYAYVGGVFGKNAYANLTNITVDVNEGSYVKAESEGYRTYVGGVVGFMGEGNITVKNVTSNIDVIGSTLDVGGIAGIAHYNNKFINCSSSGDVTLTNGAGLEIGGIAGTWHNQNGTTVTFEDCSYTGTLTATVKGAAVTEFPYGNLIGAAYSASGTGKIAGDVAVVNGVQYATLADAVAAAQNGDTVTIIVDGTYTLPAFGKELTIEAAENVNAAIDVSKAVTLSGAKVTFENLTFNYGSASTYVGLQHVDTVTYNDCTINGQMFLYGNEEIFNNCIFNTTNADNYNVWTYGAKKVDFNECTFNSAGKSVLVYNEGATGTDLTVTDCDFIASAPVEGKAAIEIDSSLLKDGMMNHVVVDGETTIAGFADGSVSGDPLWNEKKSSLNATVTVDNVLVWPVFVAEIGETQYVSIQAAVDAAENGDTITVIEDVAGEAVTVDKSVTITGEKTLNDVTITGSNGCELTVSGLTFKGNSWINAGAASKLTVSGVTATEVAPVNGSVTNSRSAFISLGASEQHELALVVENSTIYCTGNYDAIIGWAKITSATISGNTFGSESAYNNNNNVVKIMGVAEDAVITFKSNTVYANWNGFVVAPNTTRGNAHTIIVEGNTFVGDADFVWIETQGAADTYATVKATSDNTVNGNAFTAADIKTDETTWYYYGGVDVETNADGKLIGGTFNEPSNKELVAESYKAVDNDDGTWTVVEKTYVAQIGETKYETLVEAISAAQNGDTVTLLTDTQIAAAFNITGKDITVDLADKAVTVAAGDNVLADANVTFQNGKIDITGVVVNGEGIFDIGNLGGDQPATLTLSNVEFVGDGYSSAYGIFRLFPNSAVNVESSSIDVKNEEFAAGGLFKTDDATAKVNVTDSTITADNAGKTLVHATATFTNSTVTITNIGEDEHGFNRSQVTLVDSDVTISGGTGRGITAEHGDLSIDGDSTVTVTDMDEAGIQLRGKNLMLEGEVKADLNAHSGTNEVHGSGYLDGDITVEEGATLLIYGGTYTVDPTTWVAEGCMVLDNQNGTWTVIPGTSVAQNVQTGKVYSDVSDALAEAEDGQTVILLKDTSDTYVLVTPGVTLDLNGKTLEADYVVGFATSNVIDSTDANTGLLVVDKGNIVLDAGNAMTPVYNGKGYVFSKVSMVDNNYGMGLKKNEDGSVEYKFVTFFDYDVDDLLFDGAGDNELSVAVTLSWTTENGTASQSFVYNDDQVGKVVQADGKLVFELSLVNIDVAENLTVCAKVLSETGAVLSGTVVEVN